MSIIILAGCSLLKGQPGDLLIEGDGYSVQQTEDAVIVTQSYSSCILAMPGGGKEFKVTRKLPKPAPVQPTDILGAAATAVTLAQ